MPEFFPQSETGSRGLRESRRSDAQHQLGLAAKRSLRSKQSGPLTENYQSGNRQVPAGYLETNRRRSSSGVTSGGLAGGVMTDITNATAGQVPLAEKPKPIKPLQRSFQPPATATPREEAIKPSQRSLKPPADATTTSWLPTTTTIGARPQAGWAGPAMLPPQTVASVPSDPQSVQEYVPDIIHQLFSTEALALPRADYMDSQSDITPKMRMILMDWLIEVHMKYRLRAETLHLATNLIDRYLSKKQITRKRLQLVGVAAMFIASKFEEIHPPELHDWVYITDGAYTKDDVLTMENNMLGTLSFKIVVPTAAHFFDHLVVANGCDSVHRSCTQYLLELGLLESRMLQYRPSHIVSAALLLSNELFARSPVWPQAMIHQSGYAEPMLGQCVQELRQLLKADRADAGGQQAVFRKFSTPQHHAVATMSF